tara:strand:+ start:7014 stop:8264 length:1251 start_codon:yes stop_codon:yes gene_type:complete
MSNSNTNSKPIPPPRRSGRNRTEPNRLMHQSTSGTKKQPKKKSNKRKRKDSSSSSSTSSTSSNSSYNKEKNIFVNELVKSWDLPANVIKEYLIKNDYTLSKARGIMQDFTNLLKTESIRSGDTQQITERGIYSNINTNCTKNLIKDINDNKNICFCCGEPIDIKSTDKACDHVIPIITMLVTVDPDTVPNNLHYIHKSCNNKKSNFDIWTVYKNIGRLDGIFKKPIEQKIKEKNNQALTYQEPNARIEKCKEIFMTILKSIKIRTVSDMKFRKDTVDHLNKNVFGHLQDYVNHYLNPTIPAEILLKMGKDKKEIKINLEAHKALKAHKALEDNKAKILLDIEENKIKDMISSKKYKEPVAESPAESSSRYSRGNSTKKQKKSGNSVNGARTKRQKLSASNKLSAANTLLQISQKLK